MKQSMWQILSAKVNMEGIDFKLEGVALLVADETPPIGISMHLIFITLHCRLFRTSNGILKPRHLWDVLTELGKRF